MARFVDTISPTPFGYFDSDTSFQSDADKMAVFVKRSLGDDVLSVELTNKQIWSCFEEAICEYSRLIHEMKITSDLVNMLGMPTGSVDMTNRYPHYTLEYLQRQAEPYSMYANVAGSYNQELGYFNLVAGQQDYDLYTDLLNLSGSVMYNALPSGSKGKMRVAEIFHFEPLAAQQFLLNASNITNFLATNFNYESYVNSTVFYVLPIFEDVLRRGMLEAAFRVRRSNYSYQLIGGKIRIFPIPNPALYTRDSLRLYVRIAPPNPNPLSPTAYPQDDSIYGVSGPENVPYGNIPYATITMPGRQWVRQYTLSLCMELLGLIRGKFKSIPIPNADMTLNGDDLLSKGREDKEKLTTHMKEFLAGLTNQKLLEAQALQAEALQKQLRYVPMPTVILVG